MRLYVVRHGKAEKDAPTGRDDQRPLAPKGREQAQYLATQLKAGKRPLEHKPKVILSSTAIRAADTARLIAEVMGMKVTFEEALSPESETSDVYSLIIGLVKHTESALVVGHNPALEKIVAKFGGVDELRTGELSSLNIIQSAGKFRGEEIGRVRLESE